ncbi:MAG: TonB family protein [Candidatus Aminicenantales bacterium]
MNEPELIAACLAGRGEEFRGIVDAYKSQIMALAVNILGNREDAEDACQETLVQVFRHLADYDSGRSFRTWIFMILHRRCLDMLRKKKRFRLFFEKAARDSAPEAVNSPAGPASGGIAGQEMLCALHPKERAALPPVRAEEKITPPDLVKRVEPAYPPDAQKAGVEGIVILEATTDVYGRVASVSDLDQAAIDAVKQWVYKPLLLDGKPRGCIFTVTVRFSLK